MKGFKLYFLLIFIGLAINSKAQNRTLLGLFGGGEGVTQSFNFGNASPAPP
jgi:hypothetical protein